MPGSGAEKHYRLTCLRNLQRNKVEAYLRRGSVTYRDRFATMTQAILMHILTSRALMMSRVERRHECQVTLRSATMIVHAALHSHRKHGPSWQACTRIVEARVPDGTVAADSGALWEACWDLVYEYIACQPGGCSGLYCC